MERNVMSDIRDREKEESVHVMLLSAVEQNDEQTLQILLSSGADVNSRDKTGNTALHAAAKLGHARLCCLLVQNEAGVNFQNHACITPLFLASRANLQTVHVLIQLGADVSLRNHLGEIPLHAASCSGLVDVIVELMTSGSDVNAASWQGLTPLCVAINSGSRNAVKTLLRFGANPNQVLLDPEACVADLSEKEKAEEHPHRHHVRVRVPGAAGQQHQRGPQRPESPRVVGHHLSPSPAIRSRGGHHPSLLPGLPRSLRTLVHPPGTQRLHGRASPHPESVLGAQQSGSLPGGVRPGNLLHPLRVEPNHPLSSSPTYVPQQRDGVERGLNSRCETALPSSSSSSEAVSAYLCNPVSSSSCSCLFPAAFSDTSLPHECTHSKSDRSLKPLLSTAEQRLANSKTGPSFSEPAVCQSWPETELPSKELTTHQSACAHVKMEETTSEELQHDLITHPQYEGTSPKLSKDTQRFSVPREAVDNTCRSEEETKVIWAPHLSSNYCDDTDLSAVESDVAEETWCTDATDSKACDSANPVQTDTSSQEIQDLSPTVLQTPKPSTAIATTSHTVSSATTTFTIPVPNTEKEESEKHQVTLGKQFRGVTFRHVADDSSASMHKTMVVDLGATLPATSETNKNFKSCSSVLFVRPKVPKDLIEATSGIEAKLGATEHLASTTINAPYVTTLGDAEGPETTMPPIETSTPTPSADLQHALENRTHRRQTELTGFTALHRAAQLGMESICEALLESGAEVNARTTRGETPLHLAAKYANTGGRGDTGGLVRLLLRAGADVDAVTSSGETALHLAALVGDALFASVLIAESADVRRKDFAGNTALHKSCERIVSPEAQRVRTVRVLLSSGARPDEVNRHGLTPLHVLLLHRDDSIDLDVVRVLVSYKADPNRLTGSGEHPLLLALHNRLFSFAGVLVEKGADPNVVDEDDGKTPMHYACKAARPQLFKLLWAKGGNPTKVDYKGFTPLRYAVESGSEAMVRVCVNTGASAYQHFESDLSSVHFDSRNPPSLSELFESSSVIPSPLLCAFLRAQTAILALLYKSGCFSFSELHFLRVVCERLSQEELPESQKEVILFVLEISQSPPSLQNFCRWQISHLIGCGAERKMRMRELRLPTMLRNFVLFVDDA